MRKRKKKRMWGTCIMTRMRGQERHPLVNSRIMLLISKEFLLPKRSIYQEGKSCYVPHTRPLQRVPCVPRLTSCHLLRVNVSLAILPLTVSIIRLQASPLRRCRCRAVIPYSRLLKLGSSTKNPCSSRKKTIISCSGECIYKTRICWQTSRM